MIFFLIQNISFPLSLQVGPIGDGVSSLFPGFLYWWTSFSSGALGALPPSQIYLIRHEVLKSSTALLSVHLPSCL